MSKIAVLGSSVDNFLKSHYDLDMIEKNVFSGIQRMTDPDEDIILTDGEQGVGSVVLGFDCDKHVYLPQEPEVFCKDWSGDAKFWFGWGLGSSEKVIVINSDMEGARHIILMLNDCDYMINFWVGERSGKNYENMLLARSMGKKIYHGLDNVEIDEDLLIKGWSKERKED